jgi:hypothetical protein
MDGSLTNKFVWVLCGSGQLLIYCSIIFLLELFIFQEVFGVCGIGLWVSRNFPNFSS